MSTSWRKRLYWLGLGLGLFFFLGQVLKGYQVLLTLTLDISLIVRLSGATVAGLAALGLQMAAWRVLMQDLGVRLTWRSIVGGYMLSFLPRYVPGSIWGYLSRSEWLKRSYGISYSLSGTGSILEVAMALITGSAVIGFYCILITTGLVQVTLLVLEIAFPLVSWFTLKFVFQLSFVKKRHGLLHSHGSEMIGFANWSKVFLLYIMLWLCYGVLVLILVDQFDLSSAPSSLAAATFSFCVSWLIGFLVVFLPSGLGIREIALSNILASIMGVPPDVGSAVSVLTRLCIAVAELLWVFVGIVLQRARITHT